MVAGEEAGEREGVRSGVDCEARLGELAWGGVRIKIRVRVRTRIGHGHGRLQFGEEDARFLERLAESGHSKVGGVLVGIQVASGKGLQRAREREDLV